jgi:hypothetical protein
MGENSVYIVYKYAFSLKYRRTIPGQITYTLYKAATNIIKKKMKKSKYNVYGYKAMGPFRDSHAPFSGHRTDVPTAPPLS